MGGRGGRGGGRSHRVRGHQVSPAQLSGEILRDSLLVDMFLSAGQGGLLSGGGDKSGH